MRRSLIAALLAAVGVAALLLLADALTYTPRPPIANLSVPSDDEAAHRAEIERATGPVNDWPAYLQVVREICDDDEQGFALTAAVFADKGDLDAFRINVRHACPDRSDEVEEMLRMTSVDPCVNPTTDSQRRIAEASGCFASPTNSPVPDPSTPPIVYSVLGSAERVSVSVQTATGTDYVEGADAAAPPGLQHPWARQRADLRQK